jgi:hypothetical protein
MKIFLFRTQACDIVARTSRTELVDGNEDTYEYVGEFLIDTHLSHLRHDDPKLQRLLCDVFVEAALWARDYPEKIVKRWESIADSD